MNRYSSQKDAVYDVIISILDDNYIVFYDYTETVSDLINEEMRKEIECELFNLFQKDLIPLGKKYSPDMLMQYCKKLVFNWCRIDTRLNGGIKYKPYNTRNKYTTDPMIKELNRLLKITVKKEDRLRIIDEIQKRKRELFSKENEIDASLIPSSLKDLIP